MAPMIVGTANGRRIERERASRCLEFARELGATPPSGRAALGIAMAERRETLAGSAVD